MKVLILEKEYDGEDLFVEVGEDIIDAFNANNNPELRNIPTDKYGFHTGTFKIILQWEGDDDTTDGGK